MVMLNGLVIGLIQLFIPWWKKVYPSNWDDDVDDISLGEPG